MKKGGNIILIIIGLIVVISIAAFVIIMRNEKIAQEPQEVAQEQVEEVVENTAENIVENTVVENTVEEPEVKDENDDDPLPQENNPLVGYIYGRELSGMRDYKDGTLAVKFKKTDKWRVLDKDGKRVGKKEYNDLSQIKNGIMTDFKKDGEKDTFCLVDARGNKLTEYTILKPIEFGESDYAPAAKADGSVFVNKMGNFQTDKYESIIANDNKTVFAAKQAGHLIVLNDKLEVVNDLQTNFGLVGFMGDLICFFDNYKLGLMTTGGEILQQPKYSELKYGLIDGYGVMTSLSGESVLMDSTGNEVFSIGDGCYFEPFTKPDGDVKDVVYVRQEGGKTGLINTKTGSFVMETIYDDIRYLGHGLFMIRDGENCGIRDANGQEFIPIADGIRNIERLDDARLGINQNGLWYIYDYGLNLIREEGLEYDEIHTYSDGYAVVEKNIFGETFYGLIDSNYNLAYGNFEGKIEE